MARVVGMSKLFRSIYIYIYIPDLTYIDVTPQIVGLSGPCKNDKNDVGGRVIRGFHA